MSTGASGVAAPPGRARFAVALGAQQEVAGDQRDGGEARGPPEGGAERAGDAGRRVRCREQRAGEHDGEDRRADRAADAHHHVQLRRRVGQLVSLERGERRDERRHEREADADAADDHHGAEPDERRVRADQAERDAGDDRRQHAADDAAGRRRCGR